MSEIYFHRFKINKNIKGQCRGGKAGYGPTDPKWIKQYCRIHGKFYNQEEDAWAYESFDLCRHKLQKVFVNGTAIIGKEGLWSAIENKNYESNWVKYVARLKAGLEKR